VAPAQACVHEMYCSTLGVPAVAELAGQLLLPNRLPAPLPKEGVLGSFEEATVQTLAQAVALPRQTAVESLKHAGGSLNIAFKNELSRLRLDRNMLDAMVFEYLVYRGLMLGSAGAGAAERGSTPLGAAASAGAASSSTAAASTSTGGRDSGSGSGVAVPLRWVGRGDTTTAAAAASDGGGGGPDGEGGEGTGSQRFAAAMAVREAVAVGDAVAAEAGVRALDATFFDANPELLFSLKRLTFLQLVAQVSERVLLLARRETGELEPSRAEHHAAFGRGSLRERIDI